MRKILVVLISLLVLGCSVRDKMEQRCRAECPEYGAVFVNVSRHCADENESCWECWCRRPDPVLSERPDCVVLDTDHGEICSCRGQPSEAIPGGEPLRIW
jgi:hypothetical protein